MLGISPRALRALRSNVVFFTGSRGGHYVRFMITRKGLDETVAPCVPEHRGRRWRRSHGLSDPRSPAGAARRPATAVGSLRGSATTFCLRVLPVVLGVAVA